MRYDGMYPPEIEDGQALKATRVKLTELRDHLSQDEPTVSPAERAAAIAARRRHVARRNGN